MLSLSVTESTFNMTTLILGSIKFSWNCEERKSKNLVFYQIFVIFI